jgi:1-deoxy-D-xylulose-5-phosphate synthase
MIRTFQAAHREEGPVLVHVATTKGKGYPYAEADQVGYHAQSAFDLATGKAYPSSKPKPPSWSKVFGQTLVKICEQDPRVVGITAAMATGTGLDLLEKALPHQYFDVGIAEQHAVTGAAGMAMGGLRPIVAIYSTFLSRAWDQVVYDVALHRLPVIFCLDRAGITGDDGPSHHGVYDMALLAKVPGMRVLAPSSLQELQVMLHDAVGLADAGPVVIRYPKGAARQVGEHEVGSGVQARRLREGDGRVAVLAVGKLVGAAEKAAAALAADGIEATVWDVRCCAPLDAAMIADAARHGAVVTCEDGIRDGGIGMTIADQVHALAPSVPVEVLGVPTVFIPQAKPDRILASMGLDADGIEAAVRAALQ